MERRTIIHCRRPGRTHQLIIETRAAIEAGHPVVFVGPPGRREEFKRRDREAGGNPDDVRWIERAGKQLGARATFFQDVFMPPETEWQPIRVDMPTTTTKETNDD